MDKETALSAFEVAKKALKKGKNDLLHARLGNMGETHSKKIISIVDNIDNDPTKIFFYELCIGAKIIKNPSTKPMSKVTTKLSKVYINF